MAYVMDPSLMDQSPTEEPQVMYQQQPTQAAPASFRLVLPFASFDRSTPTKLAGSILNLSALLTCLVWVYFMGRFGVMAGKTLATGIIAVIFTLTTTILLSSGYKIKMSEYED